MTGRRITAVPLNNRIPADYRAKSPERKDVR